MAKEKLKRTDGDNFEDLPGVGPVMAEKLSENFSSFIELAVQSPKNIAEMGGITEAGAKKVIEAAQIKANLGEFILSTELKEKRASMHRLTTSSTQLDELFGGGGLPSRAISEFFGEFGCGKCVGGNTPLLYFTSDTARLESIKDMFSKHSSKFEQFDGGEISEINTPISVLSFDDKKGIVKQNVTKLYREKVSSIEELQTNRGNKVQITKNHPLLTITNDGIIWKSTGLLKEGDYIAVPRQMAFSKLTKYDVDDAYFIGMFVAEGTKNPLSISNTSKDIINKVVAYSVKKFGRAASTDAYDRVLLYNDFKSVLGDLAECNSGNIYIPNDILNADNTIISAFIAGYFDGDGSYGKLIEYTTKSKSLSIQMNYLLSKIGINTTVSDKIIDGEIYYRTFITDSASKKKLYELLTEATKKLDVLDTDNKSTIHGIPAVEFLNISRRVFTKISGTHRRDTTYGKQAMLNGKYSTVYSNYLTKNKPYSEAITYESADLIYELLMEKVSTMEKWYNRLESATEDDIFKALEELSIRSTDIVKETGMNKATFNNYIIRKKIPCNNIELIAQALRNIIKNMTSNEQLCKDIETIRILCSGALAWEQIKTIKTSLYDDYVYDIMVENTHNFIGGEKPLIMHNTQLCFQLAVNATMPIEKGGLDGHVIVIDTENTFRPNRIDQIATALGLDPIEVNNKIHVAQAFNSAHQMLLLSQKAKELAKKFPVKLIIVDSLTSHFRSEYVGRGCLADRQGLLSKHMRELLNFADVNNAVAVVTNQVLTNPGQMFGDPTKPVGGNIVGHMCETYDTLIQNSDGSIKKIGEMKARENVECVNWKKNNLESGEVTVVTQNTDTKEIYKIYTNNHNKCSGGHRFFVAQGNEILEKEAKNLKVGDFIAQARRINIIGEVQELPIYTTNIYVVINEEDAEKIKAKISELKISYRDIGLTMGISSKQLRNILNERYPTLAEKVVRLITVLQYKEKINTERVFSNKHKDLKFPTTMTPELAQIYGYFLGDGNYEERGLRFTDAGEEVLQKYSELFKQEFNIEAKVKKSNTKNCYRLYVNSKEIRNMFEDMYGDIYSIIGKSKVDVVNAFIKGFVDAEGYISKKIPKIVVTQKNEEVLRYIQMFLLRSGVRSTMTKRIGKQEAHTLRISDEDIVNYGQMGFTATDKQRLLEGYIDTKESRNKQNIHPMSSEDIIFEKIKKIEIVENAETLYDLSVPGNENYIANGIVVHNSTYRLYIRKAKEGKRMVRMVDSPENPTEEVLISVSEEGVRNG